MADPAPGRVTAALHVLELVSNVDRVSAREVGECVGMSTSAAHRLLQELEEAGYVARGDGGRGYSAGPALVRQSHAPVIDARTRFRLRPILQDVREETGESVHVSTLAGGHVLVVDGRRSSFALDIGLRVGMVAPATTMAAGKLLLAALSDRTVFELVGPDPLPRRSRSSIATLAELRLQLAQIRVAGAAKTVQESEPGVNSVAVPLDGSTWRDRTALVISVPVERGGPDRMHQLERAARRAVAEAASAGRIQPWRFNAARRPRPAKAD